MRQTTDIICDLDNVKARIGELAAELRGYRATQSALAVGSVQHLGGCHV